MAIKDLSENLRMPRLGKIHLGIRDKVKGYPIKTDYFVLPADHPDYKNLVALYGEKPKEMRVLIPTEDINEWAPQFYKAYDLTHGLICKGDGEAAKRMVDVNTEKFPSKDTKTTTFKDMECLGKECPEYRDKKCGEVMNLLFILADVPGLGVWQIDTGSINSILNINSCARLIKSIYKRIVGVPLKLTLEPHQVNNPESGKKQTVYVLNLRTDFTLTQLAAAARNQNQQFLIETPDMAAVYEEKVNRDIEELWPNDRNPEGPTAKAVVIESTAREVKPEEKAGPPPDEHINNISMQWLNESLTTLQKKKISGWSNTAAINYLNGISGKQAKSVREAVSNLTPEQAVTFVKRVQDILEMA